MAYQRSRISELADPTRRTIFERVAGRPSAVGELAGDLPISRPAVSQHLKVLKDAGLVIDEPDGARRIYRVDPEGVDALRAYLDQFWNQALTAFKRIAEQKEEDHS
jgi:DNA-binding transcriptional ArsR family regulator